MTENTLSQFSTADLQGTAVVKTKQDAAWSVPQCPFSPSGSIKTLERHAHRFHE